MGLGWVGMGWGAMGCGCDGVGCGAGWGQEAIVECSVKGWSTSFARSHGTARLQNAVLTTRLQSAWRACVHAVCEVQRVEAAERSALQMLAAHLPNGPRKHSSRACENASMLKLQNA